MYLLRVSVLLLALALVTARVFADDPGQETGDDCLVIGINAATPQLGYTVRQFRAAMDAADICVSIFMAPANRNTVMMQRGRIDGEIYRVADYQTRIPAGSVRVEPPLLAFRGYLVCKCEVADIPGMSVAYKFGFRWHEQQAERFASARKAHDFEVLVKLLKAGRVDGGLIDMYSLQDYRNELEGFARHEVTRQDLYIYLHPSRAHLAARIGDAVKTWLDAGNGFFRLDSPDQD